MVLLGYKVAGQMDSIDDVAHPVEADVIAIAMGPSWSSGYRTPIISILAAKQCFNGRYRAIRPILFISQRIGEGGVKAILQHCKIISKCGISAKRAHRFASERYKSGVKGALLSQRFT